MRFASILRWSAIGAVFICSARAWPGTGIWDFLHTGWTPREQRLFDRWRDEDKEDYAILQRIERDWRHEKAFAEQLNEDLQKAALAEGPSYVRKLAPEVADFIATKALAEAGDAQAQLRLALMYDQGRGTPRDYYSAFVWYLEAAKKGLPVAQHNVGVAYVAGLGVQKNDKEALMWLSRAADKGDSQAGEYAERLKKGESATAPVVVVSSIEQMPETARTSSPPAPNPKEAIIAQVVKEYAATHKYIDKYFVCVDFATGVWYELMHRGINAKVRVGSLVRQLGSINEANHAWVMAEVSLGTWLAVEPQGRIIYPGTNPYYYRGYDFSGDSDVRHHNGQVRAVEDARKRYADAVKELNEYRATYNSGGGFPAMAGMIPVINSQQLFVEVRERELNEELRKLSEICEKAKPSL